MGYHPETLAFSFPPYPAGLIDRPKPWSLARALYALKPWIGFDVWHIDPERPDTGNRTDDSCGWFDRTPGDYADAVKYLVGDTTTMHEIKLVLGRMRRVPTPFYEGISEPRDPDSAPGYPRLSHGDTLAVCLLIARELELRRWWNGQNGKVGRHGAGVRGIFMRRRSVDGIAFDLALNPLDNLSSVDEPELMVTRIAAALNRHFRPWWRHPRWHVHHWQINFDLVRNVRRMFEPCATCRRPLGFGYCPHADHRGHHHAECLGIRMGAGPAA